MKAKTQIRAGLNIAGLSINISQNATAILGGPGAAIALTVGVAVGNAIVVSPKLAVNVG